MNCKKCGSPLVPGTNTCIVCGAAIETTDSSSQGANQTIVPPTFGANKTNQEPVNNGVNVSPTNLETSIPNPAVTPVQNSNNSISNMDMSSNPFMVNQNSVNSPSTNPQPISSPVSPNPSVPSTPQPENLSQQQNMVQQPTSAMPAEESVTATSETTPVSAVIPQTPNGVEIQTDATLTNANSTNNNQTPEQAATNQPIPNGNPVPPQETANQVTLQPALEEVGEPKKKKVKVGLIVVIVLVLAIVAFFGYQYITLTNQANKIKNSNPQLNDQDKGLVSEDAYETIAHQDEYYVEYDFDYNTVSEMYENEYTIGSHKVKISISSNKMGIISINDSKQTLSYPVVKIYHLLKSDTLFIENQLSTNKSELFIFTGGVLRNMKDSLKGSQYIENVSIKDNALEFTSGFWNEAIVSNGDTSFNVCQDTYTTYVTDDFAIEAIYTFNLQETTYSIDKLASTTTKTIKQLHDEICPAVTTPAATPETPTQENQAATNPPTTTVPVEQTPQIQTITPTE